MDKRLYFNNLYDYYKDLFTQKQQEYFEDYYYENLSLGEIAENHHVSRNAIHTQIRMVETRLEELEKILGLMKKKNKIITLLTGKVSEEILQQVIELL